ncbi:MAG: PaaX family transcriptional regulator [Patescibacteria group bacterium]|nr:MAG: PaaX family transcriptional regulator [Patescibacteria group bacterium]
MVFISFVLKFPFVRFLKDEWDGKWRIISYEIPEVKRHLRDRLRREMEGWGLGPWHRSFWLTPHPVIENLRDLVLGKEEEQYVQAFTADHSFGDKTVLIKKVFKIDDLESQYKNLFKKWYEVLSTNLDNTEKFKKVIVEYVEVLKTDPGLPVNILGSAWIGFEGWRLFNEIKSLLYKPNNG